MTDTVLVVGSGPVGLTMALELARYRVPVRLVDRMTARSDKSRAVAVWTRTLELLDRAGVSGELVARGNTVGAARIVAGREPIGRLDLSGVASPYPFVLMLPQSDTEAVLERRLEAFGARTELGVELTRFTQDADGVEATLHHADGHVETARFAFLVACDGSHSPVRHGLGLAFDGDTMGTDWALGDFHISGSPAPLDELATYWHADGPIVFFPMAPGRYRLIASLGPSGETPPVPPTTAGFQAIVDRRGPGGIVLGDPIWTSAFRINERQVSSYRVGRVFLAGDAARVHSPAGGQGMNTGMQDAVNLAWKLALVCRGLGPTDVLLDSYDAERRPVGAEVIAASGRLTSLATLRNPIVQELRNIVGHFMLGLAPVRRALEGTMTETSIGYPDSPLNGDSSGSQPAGARMPSVQGEPPYGAGDTPRFTLRAATAANDATSPLTHDLLDPAVRVNEAGAGIDLVRPDGYLAMSAPSGEWATVADYLDGLAPTVPTK